MKGNAPKSLIKSMSEDILFNCFRSEVLSTGAPVYCGSSCRPSEECLESVSQMSLSRKIDLAWMTLERAHDFWRRRPETIEMLLDESCVNCLNVFTRLELAGPEVYNVWAKHFYRLFKGAFPFDEAFDDTCYKRQMDLMEEVYFNHSLFLSNIYVIKRREFAEKEKLAGKGDLYNYVSDMKNDILGVVRSADHLNRSNARSTAQDVCRRMYYDSKGGMSFRLSRQIILANQNDSPINW